MKSTICSIEKGDWPDDYWKLKLKELGLPRKTVRILGNFELMLYYPGKNEEAISIE